MGTAAERAEHCALPPELESPTTPLPSLARAVRDPAGAPRVAVLSPQTSSTRAAVRGLDAYPARLSAALTQELSAELRSRKLPVEVVVKPLGTTEDLGALVSKRVLPLKPNLVIWQIGRTDARRGTPPYRFAEQLSRGLGTLAENGIDVIVLDLQYHPQFEAMFRTDEYRNYIRWVVAKRDVALLRRYEMIEYWLTSGLIDLDSGSTEGERKSFEFIQDCLTHQLTRMIATGLRQSP